MDLSGFVCAALCLSLATPGRAQVTTTSDDDPAPAGSLRAEVDASLSGDTIDIQIPSMTDVELIGLRTLLTFDNDVTLDNSDSSFSLVDIDAPAVGSFFEIEDGVDVILRDLGLVNGQSNGAANINLQSATSTLTLDVEREDQSNAIDITGPGSLFKEGSASLTLSGANTFSGGLTIREGDVVGDLTSFGSGPIELAPDADMKTARVIFDISAGGLVLDGMSPAITDSSTNGGIPILAKRGIGALDISAATIDSSIGIRVEEGQIIAGSTNFTDGHAFTIDSGATLRLDGAAAPLSVMNTLAGAGTFATEADDFTLTGDLSGFTGVFDINPGTAGSRVTLHPSTAPPGALGFDIALDDATTSFTLEDDFDITYSGNLSGGGTFIKSGTGATRLTGAASHTGGTEALAGTLTGNTNNLQGAIDVTSGASLVFSQDSSASFIGTIDSVGGDITVQKLGAGVLTLDSAQPFMGRLAIDVGGLHFAAGSSLSNADLTIGSGAAGGEVSLSADFEPAGSPDNTISIAGDLTFESDARLTVDIAETSNRNTRFAVGGAVTIQPGAELVVRTQLGTYDGSPTYDVLTFASLSGDFTIDQNLFFFNVTGAVVGNSYQITLAPSNNTLAGAGKNSNQRIVGAQLDLFHFAPNGGDATISAYQSAITSINPDEIGRNVDSVSPDDLSASTQLQLASATRTWQSISDRIALQRRQWIGQHESRKQRRARERRERVERYRRQRGGRRLPPSVEAAPVESAQVNSTKGPWVAWVQVSGLMGELDSQDAKGYDYLSAGPLLGADRALTEDTRIGFSVSGGYSHYETNEGENDGDGVSIEATVYGAWLGDPVEVLVGARYAHAWIETRRLVEVGTEAGFVKGEFEGDVFGAYAEFSRGFALPHGIEIAPIASVTYTHLAWEDFDETGASPLRMQIDEQDVDSALTSIGLRLSMERAMEEGVLFRPRMKLLWNHEWADVDREVSGRFASDPTTGLSPFTVAGAEPPRDHAEVSIGWEVGFTENSNLFLAWNGRFGEDLIENALSLGCRVVW